MGKHVQRRGSRRRNPEEWKKPGIWGDEEDQEALPPLPGGYSRRRSHNRRWPAVLAAVLLILILAVAGTYRWLTAPLSPQESRLNLLVMGTDSGTLDNSRADTIMLFSLDWKTRTLSILSIPRDTRVRLPGQEGYQKINAANAIGGPELMTRVVGDLLGIPVKHYARINFAGFAKIVDTLGGVVINVEKPMNYDDFSQSLHIHLEPGKQLLNGQEALGYMRFRHDGLGDVTAVDQDNQVYEGRIERQQKFVAAVAHQFLQPGVLFRLPRLAAELKGAADTDLSLPEMYKYFVALKDMQRAKVRTFTVPGESVVIDKVSYWVPDTFRIPGVVKDFLAAPEPAVKTEAAPEESLPATAEVQPQVPAAEEASPAAEVKQPASEAQPVYQPVIEILNGSGVNGMAARAAKVFTAKGFKVVRTENADRHNYEFSVIILRSDRVARLEEITSLIRDPAEFRPEIDPKSKVDVTIILSKKSGF